MGASSAACASALAVIGAPLVASVGRLLVALSLLSSTSLAQDRDKRISWDELQAYLSDLQSEGTWTPGESRVWSYYFANSTPGRLQDAGDRLRREGFDIASIHRGEPTTAEPTVGWWLLVTREDTHTAQSLHDLNQRLYLFAEENGIDSYAGPILEDDPDSSLQDIEQAVRVEFRYRSQDRQPIYDLETRLSAELQAAQLGHFDGNEIALGDDDSTLFMYGPNADAIFAKIRPILERTPFLAGARVVLTYGSEGPSTPTTTVVLPRSGNR